MKAFVLSGARESSRLEWTSDEADLIDGPLSIGGPVLLDSAMSPNFHLARGCLLQPNSTPSMRHLMAANFF